MSTGTGIAVAGMAVATSVLLIHNHHIGYATFFVACLILWGVER